MFCVHVVIYDCFVKLRFDLIYITTISSFLFQLPGVVTTISSFRFQLSIPAPAFRFLRFHLPILYWTSYCMQLMKIILLPYPLERGPTTEYRPTSQFGLNFLLRSNVHSNMRQCVAALENVTQMAGLWGLNFK